LVNGYITLDVLNIIINRLWLLI